jgi:GTP cyclohydrolase I
MNAPLDLLLPDVQALPDERSIPIDRVGVRRLRHPVTVGCADGSVQATVATFEMAVGLPAHLKGTHMSRFVELLPGAAQPLGVTAFRTLAGRMLERLGADSGWLDARFPFFLSKAAPVSGVTSLMDYSAGLSAEARPGRCRVTLTVEVPVTSLCPCSKEISQYGAHNQRSHVTIAATLAGPDASRAAGELAIEDLVAVAERHASCQLWGLLKRPDEKFVTETAYDNPKFVEDLVRDVALDLARDGRIEAFTVECENFESIHNHSAYAVISHDRRDG